MGILYPNHINQLNQQIMKTTQLLVAILFSGIVCEAEMSIFDNIEQCKRNVIENYALLPNEIKEWRIEL